MINLAVISIKDIIKFLKRLILTIIIFISICKILGNLKSGNYVNIEDLKTKSFFYYSKIIDKTFIISNYYNNENIINQSGIKKILVSELSLLATEAELMELENQEEIVEFENIDIEIKNEDSEMIKNTEQKETELQESTKVVGKLENVPEKIYTEIINKNNKKDTYTDIYKNVKIKNESKYQLTEDILTPDFLPQNKNDIIIYHTHTCESYTPTEKDKYEASGNFRTTDLNYSVSRVGSELEKYLINTFNVKHDVTYHDYPAYSGSYTRALTTIKKLINQTEYSGLVIDLHRDALGSSSSYAPSLKIGDEVAAQLMFVVGTDGGGLEHPNWQKNLKLAIKIQETANEMYPGLFKPIIVRNSRYNQHVSDSACIIEVGATGNTLEQCNTSMKYLAKVLEKVLK